jgi:hypothetical protein
LKRLRALFAVFDPPPANPMVWHARTLVFPRRCIDGRRACTVYRRKTFDGQWQYMRREETEQEKDEWQW